MAVLQGGPALWGLLTPRLAALALAYLLYLGVMLLLGITLSLFARSSATALALCLLVWLVAVFLLPFSGLDPAPMEARSDGAGVAARVAALERERDEQLEALRREDPLRARPGAFGASFLSRFEDGAVLRRFGSAPYYDALARYHVAEIAVVLETAERIDALRREAEPPASRLRRAMRFLSPAALLDSLSRSLAATSREDHRRFLEASRLYRDDLIAYLGQKKAFSSWRWFTDDSPEEMHPWPRFLGLEPEEVPATEADALFNRLREPAAHKALLHRLEAAAADPRRRLPLDDLPAFTPTEPKVIQALAAVAGEGIGLLVWCVGLGLLARWRSRRFLALDELGRTA
jgi:hypothetical protein